MSDNATERAGGASDEMDARELMLRLVRKLKDKVDPADAAAAACALMGPEDLFLVWRIEARGASGRVIAESRGTATLPKLLSARMRPEAQGVAASQCELMLRPFEQELVAAIQQVRPEDLVVPGRPALPPPVIAAGDSAGGSMVDGEPPVSGAP